MIRNVCIHITNEQPLLADLFGVPASTDAGLLCTNVRTMDGKRPVFIDRVEATFFFPYHIIRFMEIPEGALEGHLSAPPGSGRDGANADSPDDRAAVSDVLLLPVPAAAASGGNGTGEDRELEIDEGFLQRIRDI